MMADAPLPPDPLITSNICEPDTTPPLEPLPSNDLSEPTSDTLPVETTNEVINGYGAWAKPIGDPDEGEGFWGDQGKYTESTWYIASEWGSDVRVGLRPDYGILRSDHLDHLPTETWARIQREYRDCSQIVRLLTVLNSRLSVQRACSSQWC